MDDEVQLISDGAGLAVIGHPLAVERFLVSEGLPAKDLGLHRLGSVLAAGSGVAQAGSEIAANSGRWVQLTRESVQAVSKYGLRESSKSGLSTGVLNGSNGQIRGFVEFMGKGRGSLLSSPAMLAGAAGIMAQLAMQQAMDEITDYLAVIDEKVDDILRAQKDAVLADMIGVDLVIEEAMTIRAEVGRVSEVTWSKVQTTPVTISKTQAYALRQLDALAEKLEHKGNIGDLTTAVQDAETKVQEWLAVLARCFQLQDAIGVLELDRVLDAAPEDLDRHRLGLKTARQNRLQLIARSTERLLARMDAAADTANNRVLLHPAKAPAVVQSSNHVSTTVTEFHRRLGIEGDRQTAEARRWADAAKEVRDKVLETGAGRVDAARRTGVETFDRAKSATGKLAERALRRRRNGEDRDEDRDQVHR
jgi:hypothetical protein